MIGKLAFRPAPLPNESFLGYIVRLTRENCLPTPHTLAMDAGGGRAWFRLPSRGVLERLATLVDKPVEQLYGLWLNRFAGKFNLLDSSSGVLEDASIVRFLHHSKRGHRVCPRCLAEGNPMHILWQLRPVTACLHHEQLLVERCRCGKPINYKCVYSGKCSCGTKLMELEGTPVPRGSQGYQAQQAIQERLLRPAQDSGDPDRVWFATLDLFQKWFSSFPPGSLSVDGFANDARTDDVPKFWFPVELDHLHYTLAWKTLSGGEQAFYDLCHRWLRHAAPQRAFTAGFHRDFARVREILTDYPREHFEHVYTWLGNFLDRHWKGGYASQLRALRRRERQRVSPFEAAKYLRRPAADVVLLVYSGVLRGELLPRTSSGRLRALVYRDALVAYRERREAAIPLAEAARRTGLPQELLRWLHLHGHLRAETGPRADGDTMPTFHPETLDQFLETLRRNATPPTGDAISLFDRYPWEASRLLGEALAGARSLNCEVENGLVRGLAVGQAVASVRTTDQPHPSTLPRPQAARSLGVTVDLLDILVQHGLLREDRGQVQGVDRFLQEFLWEAAAAHLLGQSIPQLRQAVAMGRFKPVLRIGTGMLLRRSEIERFAPENCCGVREAASILGCHPQDVARKYIARGDLHPIGGPGVDQGRDILLSRHEVLDLAARVRPSRTIPSALTVKPVSGKMVDSRQAAELLGCRSVMQFHHLYRRTGRLEPCRRDPRSRKDYYWLDEVLALREAQETVRAAQSSSDMLSASEAAKMLGLSERQFYRALVETELLKPALARQGGLGARFRRQDVEAWKPIFLETVKAKQVRQLLGVSQVTLWRWREQGVLKPVSGPTVDGLGDYRYRIEDVYRLATQRERLKATGESLS